MRLYLVILFVFGQLVSSANDSQLDSCLLELQTQAHQPTSFKYAHLVAQIGHVYFDMEAFQESQDYYLKCLEISQKEKLDSLTFHSLISLGEVLFWQSKYDSSLFFLNRAEDFSQQSFPLSAADSVRLYTDFGNSFYYMGNIDQAYKYRLAIMGISISKNNPQYEADNLYALAELDFEQGKNKDAIQKLNQALEIYTAQKRWEDTYFCYDLLSMIYFEQKNYKKSLEYINLACEVELTKKSFYHEGLCAHNFGKIYMHLEDYISALTFLEKAIRIQKSSFQWEELTQSQILLAELKMLMGKCDDANVLLQNGLNKANGLNIKPLRRDVYKKMSKVYAKCGKYNLAFDFQKKYTQLRDSISNDKIKKELASLSTIHQLEQSKHQLALLKKEQQLHNFYYWGIFMACVVLVVLICLAVWILKKQYKYNNQLEEHKSKIEDQNQMLFEANDKLKIVNGELENFAFIASHDLKAPLRTIANYTTLLERRYRSAFDKNGVEFLTLIVDSVEHMNQLLDDVLTFSNVKKTDIVFSTIDLDNLMEKVLQTLDANIKEKNAKVYYFNLPKVIGNSMQLFQVFQNLISNSMKFIPDDRRPEIHVKAEKKEDLICIAIQDNGIGIEEQYQDRIFKIFKRLHTQQEFKGTGIGLSICKKIVESHGGEIWVESDGKSGTTFFFTLPLAKVEEGEEQKELAKMN